MILDTSPLVAILGKEADSELYVQAISRATRCFAVGIVIEPVTVEHAYLARQAFHDFGKGRHAAGLFRLCACQEHRRASPVQGGGL